MIAEVNYGSLLIFGLFVLFTIGLSGYLARRARTASGYFAAEGGIHWFVNGVAFAGDYLSAASFLGICGTIAFFGYDGFLYSIGYLAGWVVALFVVAEPLKRMGRFTFADALNSRFQSRGVQIAAAISTLVVSVFYLIPQMVGAGALVQPLLGFKTAGIGIVLVGTIVILIVVTAGMVSTTYVQFLKGLMLVTFSALTVVLILLRGLTQTETTDVVAMPLTVQTKVEKGDNTVLINGIDQRDGGALRPIGHVVELPEGVSKTGPLNPISFFSTIANSKIVVWKSATRKEGEDKITTYTPSTVSGSELLLPGNYKDFQGLRTDVLGDRLNFVSLMLALFCGTASLPHILIRYYTVKDELSARKSTIVGIGTIGLFYVLTLYLGLGAMTSGAIDVSNSNMAAPLLAKSLANWLFAVISAIAFTTVLGTVSGLIIAGSGAIVHDLLSGFARFERNDTSKVRLAKIASVSIGALAVLLGFAFSKMNVNFLVAWAFSIAASANLPALTMVLFWKRTTRSGVIASILTGMMAALVWILLSPDTFRNVYGYSDKIPKFVPFNQPGLVTIPLSYLTLVLVSLGTQPRRENPPVA